MLLPTWFNGTAVDAFGAGRSTSPSDSAWQGRSFLAITIGDMVSAQQRLPESLDTRRLHAVVGISMGGTPHPRTRPGRGVT